jgi:precorrin-4 methylase
MEDTSLTDTAIVETARAMLDLDIPPECLPGVSANLAVLAEHAQKVEQLHD